MPVTPLRPIILECVHYSKEFASDFGCSHVSWDYTYDSPRLAMRFKCANKDKRDAFISKVRSRNFLFFIALLKDFDPNLYYPDPKKALNRWRVIFEIDPNHP